MKKNALIEPLESRYAPAALISVSDGTVTEGQNGANTVISFVVTLSEAPTSTVTVDYAAADGSATAGHDYTAITPGTLTFLPAREDPNNPGSMLPAETEKTVSVSVTDDLDFEQTESFFLNLSGATNATLSKSQGVGTILDNDVRPTLSVSDVSTPEGNSGTHPMDFVLTLSASSYETISLHYQTADNSAHAGQDYEALADQVVTFLPGEVSKTVSVSVIGNTTTEPDRSFYLQLSQPSNVTLATAQAIGTITDDDAGGQTLVNISDATVVEGTGGTAKTMVFTVTLSAEQTQNVDFHFATANGSAIAGSDYTAITDGTLTFVGAHTDDQGNHVAGETSKTISVTIAPDSDFEPNETFFVNLTSVTNAVLQKSQGVGTIQNDDVPPTISVSDATVVEGDSGTSNLVYTFTLSAPSYQPISVHYQTSDGTAHAGTDYVAVTDQVITFNPGETSKPVSVLVNGNTVDEVDKTVLLNLSQPSNATLGTTQATGTILNDDLLISISDATILEGNSGTSPQQFTVTLSHASSHEVTVDYSTANGTTVGAAAIAGKDFVAKTGTLTFAPGDTTATISVDVLGDVFGEATETYQMKLSNPHNAAIQTANGPATAGAATGTITDNDPTFTVTAAPVIEGGPGTSALMHFTVTLDHAAGVPFTFNFVTSGGTATAGSDYVAKNVPIQFAADQTTTTVDVQVLGDAVVEGDETIVAGVVYANGEAGPTGTGTIKDTSNRLVISDASIIEGDSGNANMVFIVSLLNRVNNNTVTVQWNTEDGTALATTDYAATLSASPGTISFPSGTNQVAISVPIVGDTIYEAVQTFKVKLSNANSNAVIADGEAIGTIIDNDAAPTISITGVSSVTEGDSGTKDVTYTITRTGQSETAVSVDFATMDGTATVAGGDYDAVDLTTLTFAALNGSTQSKTMTVHIHGDTTVEADETFSAVLSNVQGGTLGTATATTTIQNDDTTATLAGFTVTEGDSGTTTGQMTVTLDHAPLANSPVVVNFNVIPGTATANTDFKLVGGNSVTFAPGETTKTIDFDIIGDTLSEANETFSVALTSATNAKVNTGAVVNTITDNDPLPTISIADATIVEGDSGTKAMTFTLTLSAASGQAVSVHAKTVAGSASATSDFQDITDQTISFAAGQTTATFTVNIVGDTTDEAEENFQVQLSNPSAATLARDTATGTITDNDLRSLSIGDVSIAEGDSGTKTMTFTVSLSQAATQSVTVNYATSDGTATAGTDYLENHGSLTFAPGETSKPITITVNGDTTAEVDENFLVVLSGVQNATIADQAAVGKILNDETLFKLVAVQGTGPESDGKLTFKVVREGDKSQPATVSFTTIDGTAISTGSAADFESKTGTLNFAANPTGDDSQLIEVKLKSDAIVESAETFTLRLTGSTNGVLADSNNVPQDKLELTGTIQDSSPRPSISVGDVSIVEADSGTSNLVFTVSLSGPNTLETLSVHYATADGTALDHAHGANNGLASDYTAVSGDLAFGKGETTKTITVPITGDLSPEAAAETFSVVLSNAQYTADGGATTAATLQKGTATGTIRDNDIAPAISFGGGTNGVLSAFEGSGNDFNVVPTVKLSAASEFPVTVQVAVLPNGTATPGQDYTLPAGFTGSAATGYTQTITFQPGETSKDLSFTIAGDSIHEADETFTLNLSHPSKGTIHQGDDTLTVKLVDDDPVPALTITSQVTQVEGDAGTANMVFTVSMQGASDQAVTVKYATVDGTAKSTGAMPDFNAVAGTLTFAPGETSKTISVPIIGDTFAENNESFTVKLSGATNVLADTGTGVIQNGSDSVIGIAIQDAAPVVEGDSATKNATFHVELSKAAGSAITFTATTRNGTAISGAANTGGDYTELATTTNGISNPGQVFTIAAGNTSADVTVAINGDSTFEATESFFVTISNPSGGVAVGKSEGRGTILNDDFLVVDSRTIKYIDEDGDLATVRINKDSFFHLVNGQAVQDILTFSDANSVGGHILQLVNFTGHAAQFNGVSLSVTAEPQAGYAAAGLTSDGHVDVGTIRGAIVDPVSLQFRQGIDFGNITVQGDVAKITAGDNLITPAIAGKLSVDSFGLRASDGGSGTQSIGSSLPTTQITGNSAVNDSDSVSSFLSVVNAVKISGDMTGTMRVVGNAYGDINSLVIGGALRGTSKTSSGLILFTGTLGSATLGSIVGGNYASTTSSDNKTAQNSGSIIGSTDLGANIGSLRVLGDIRGGTGTESGRVVATRISSVNIGGNLVGGTGFTDSSSNVFGSDAGTVFALRGVSSVKIAGDIVGGGGLRTGTLSTGGAPMSVQVGGDIRGGTGEDSGSLIIDGSIASLAVGGDIVGASGQRSGSVRTLGSITKLSLGPISGDGGNLLGGSGADSGIIAAGTGVNFGVSTHPLVVSGGSIGNARIHGDVHGGTGSGSGGILLGGQLAKLEIQGSLIGGNGSATAATVKTGFVNAGRIAQLIVDQDIKAGLSAAVGLVDSGSIRAQKDIASLVVKGSIEGSSVARVVVAAGANGIGPTGAITPAIGSVTVGTVTNSVVSGGNVYSVDFLAGYTGIGTSTNPRGAATNADAQIGTVAVRGDLFATNIVAGAIPGTDTRFGTVDDRKTQATSTVPVVVDTAKVMSSIAKVLVDGTVIANTNDYGIVAERVAAVKVGTRSLDLIAGAHNDPKQELSPGTRMAVIEVVA